MNEVTVQSSLLIRSGNLSYQSNPTSFRANMVGSKGPVPGAITATLAGVQVNFSQLEYPGYCRIMNLDSTNFVTVGVFDVSSAQFIPMIELLPGETYVFRLSRYLQSSLGTGSGTDSVSGNRLMVRADTAPVNVTVEAFES